jgi:hypothetical protein
MKREANGIRRGRGLDVDSSRGGLDRAFSPRLWGRPHTQGVALGWYKAEPSALYAAPADGILRAANHRRVPSQQRTVHRPGQRRQTLQRPTERPPPPPAPTAQNISAQGNALGPRPPEYRGPTARSIPRLHAHQSGGPSALIYRTGPYPGRCPGSTPTRISRANGPIYLPITAYATIALIHPYPSNL